MKEETSHIPLNVFSDGKRARTLILCFDGTGNKFGTVCPNSNVVRFFNALEKDEMEEQLAYYQPGIGTYLKSQFYTKTASRVSTKIDEAIATGLPEHVKSGYKFLMQNYRLGDRICLFGFSRGAYTARALSGMIYKVGLLPPDNAEQLDFAYSVYKETDKEGSKLGSKFKKVFSRRVMIDFIGVWDTVSSVGIIPRSLPYSTYNDGVRVFRHALALDERRARFRASVWGEPVAEREELDVEPFIKGRGDTPRDDWVYRPPDLTHVKEVWFAGCHADVGGGSHPESEEEPSSLSNIPLRWMIKECFLAGTGIIFNKEALRDIGLDPEKLSDLPDTVKEPVPDTKEAPIGDGGDTAALVGDHIAKIWDQLQILPFWWALELIPMLSTLQHDEGWMRFRK
ncbi:hypothetical protein BD779DRAFT_1442618 [Infundibulicybe gibba]|nr:hypothetical protein BD779DRAFT_1442618 [Infundibulicybe gibba]